MKTQAVVVANDPVYQGWLQNAAGSTMDVTLLPLSVGQDMLAQIEARGRIDVVFVEFDSHDVAQRAAFVERFLERHWQVPVVGLGADDDPQWVLAAMRAGARDFFVLRRDDATLGLQIGRLLRRSSAGPANSAAAPKTGKLFGVLSAHPGESIAFLAEHVALGLLDAQGAGERVLLLDIATPAGAAAIFLNINATYSALDAINDAYRCDQSLVDTAFTRHSSGLYVLSLPEDLLGQPVIDSGELLKLLQVLRGLFSSIVVALDGHLPLSVLVGVANDAERLMLLSDQSILRSRHNKHLLRALRMEGCSLDRAGLVVDDYRRRLGLEPKNLAELFELPLFAALQSDPSNRAVSMNSGEPLYTLARKDPYALGVKKMAAALLSGLPMAPPTQGFLDRLRGG
ncbi:MAG: CpaE family protein [Nevskiales bacterium]